MNNNNTINDKLDIIGLIFGLIALIFLILSFFIDVIFFPIILIFPLLGIILSSVSQNKRIIKLLGVIVNGLVLLISLIVFIFLMLGMALFG